MGLMNLMNYNNVQVNYIGTLSKYNVNANKVSENQTNSYYVDLSKVKT